MWKANDDDDDDDVIEKLEEAGSAVIRTYGKGGHGFNACRS
jgi:hypothetical protein